MAKRKPKVTKEVVVVQQEYVLEYTEPEDRAYLVHNVLEAISDYSMSGGGNTRPEYRAAPSGRSSVVGSVVRK